ncbi:hypothetical protein KCP73_14360 [Salmonella enterica subsp. enterica]|nr:hypothetical protein KCP73_14360 [Salmonella enterica subsp. enterica]
MCRIFSSHHTAQAGDLDVDGAFHRGTCDHRPDSSAYRERGVARMRLTNASITRLPRWSAASSSSSRNASAEFGLNLPNAI